MNVSVGYLARKQVLNKLVACLNRIWKCIHEVHVCSVQQIWHSQVHLVATFKQNSWLEKFQARELTQHSSQWPSLLSWCMYSMGLPFTMCSAFDCLLVTEFIVTRAICSYLAVSRTQPSSTSVSVILVSWRYIFICSFAFKPAKTLSSWILYG